MSRLVWGVTALFALSLCGVASAQEAAAPSSLEQAYQREFAYLKAEKEALTARLVSSRAQGQTRLAERRQELDGLEGRLLSLSREADRLEAQLNEAERAGDSATEGADLLAATLAQASSTLGLAEPAEGEALGAQVARVFDAGVEAARAGGRVRSAPGAFFLADGAQVEGTVVTVGKIAAYGVWAGGSGALAPAGEGRLRIFEGAPDANTAEVARALQAGQTPSSLQIFLFEDLNKRFEERVEQTPLQVVEAGGLIAWVIVALGGVALLLVLLRTGSLAAAWVAGHRVMTEVEPLLNRGDVRGAAARCGRGDGAHARVLARVLEHVGDDAEKIESAATEAILHETPAIERFASAIQVIAAVSPLLGLLGTVTGIIATFDIITEFGTGDPKMLSGGISEALITTELGLIVAIPALLIGSLLNSRAEAVLDELELSALRVVSLAETPQGAPGTPEAPAPRAEASTLRPVAAFGEA